MSDGQPDAIPAPPVACLGIVGYTCVSFLASAAPSVLAVILWSNMGLGDTVWDFLFDKSSYQYPVGGVAGLLALGLYLLDFFCPPHLPGHHLVLWEGDRFVGKFFLFVAGVILAIAACLWPESYPQIPLIILILLSPLMVWGSRVLLKPQLLVDREKADIVDHGDIMTKLMLLSNIVGDEDDEHRFFRGALAGFWITCLCILIPYIAWDRQQGGYHQQAGLTDSEEALARIKWSCPSLVAMANFVFGCFVLLRIYLEKAYDSTDLYKGILTDDSRKFALHHELSDFKRTQTSLRKPTSPPPEGVEGAFSDSVSPSGSASQAKSPSAIRGMLSARNMAEHASAISRIQLIVKLVVVLFIVLLGGSYVAQVALSLNKTLSEMLIGLICTILIVFFVFVWLTLGRIARVMGQWVTEMPMFKMGKDMWQSSWCRALLAIMFLPVVPLILLVSWMNQKIRRCRGIYRRFPEQTRAHISLQAAVHLGDLEALRLTPRVNLLVMHVQDWDKHAVVVKSYIVCFIYILLKCSFTFASIFLAQCVEHWKRDWKDEPFVVVGLTFFLGVALFLIPVTPGMLIYIFGGLVISPTWPEKYGGWGAGCCVNIGISWALKLLACAIQQKCIGEMLGTSLWVRQQCKLHQTFIRTIEFILRQPGWSIGKVAILCGGPDWPVSVTAGLLRLSLVQMELGTLPIIFFIIPCGMAGSAYVCPRGVCMEDLATIMMLASLGVSLIQYVLIAWTAQVTLEKHEAELTRPLAKYVDLEWLDHRNAMIEKMTHIPFDEVPRVVRFTFLFGVTVHMAVGHAFFWAASNMMGEFEIQDGIGNLAWYKGELMGSPPEGLITQSLIGVWGLYAIGCVCAIQKVVWTTVKLARPRKAAAIDMDKQEAEWKEQFVKAAENWTAGPAVDVADATSSTEAVKEDKCSTATVAWEPSTSVPEHDAGRKTSISRTASGEAADNHPGSCDLERAVHKEPLAERGEDKRTSADKIDPAASGTLAGNGKVRAGMDAVPEPTGKLGFRVVHEVPAVKREGLSSLIPTEHEESQAVCNQADKQAFNADEHDSEKDVREIPSVMPGRCCCGAL